MRGHSEGPVLACWGSCVSQPFREPVETGTAKPARTAAGRCRIGAVAKRDTSRRKAKVSGRPKGQGRVAGKGPGGWGGAC